MDMEKGELTHSASGKISKLVNNMVFLKLKTHIYSDLGVPLLGLNPRDIHGYICLLGYISKNICITSVCKRDKLETAQTMDG